MLHVILDSNILHEEGLNSKVMGLLNIAIKSRLIKVYVPFLVGREFTTNRHDKIIEALNKAKQNIDSSRRDVRGIIPHFNESLDEINGMILSMIDDVKAAMDESYQEWREKFEVEVVNVNDDSISSVFDDYFQGCGVFKSKKSREDIPDAFINICIESIIKENGPSIVVMKDRAFRKHLIKKKDLKVLSSLNEVFSQNGMEQFSQYRERREVISSPSFANAISSFLKLNLNKTHFGYNYFSHEDVSGLELLGVRVYGGDIELYVYDSITSILIDDVKSFSVNSFLANFTFEDNVSFKYVTDYGALQDISRISGRSPDSDSMNGDGFCDVNEMVKISCIGNLSVDFKSSEQIFRNDEFLDALFNGDIVIGLDIKSIEIIDIL